MTNKIQLTISLLLLTTVGFAQVSGNSMFSENRGNANYQTHNITTTLPKTNEVVFLKYNDLLVTVRGMANLKADTYVAVFSATQFEKTAEKVNQTLNGRIQPVLDKLNTISGTATYIDMVSFVPKYEYEVDKKVFTKDYNEVPTGFVLKKNLHVKYSKPEQLDAILSACAAQGIYDLVKVDYYSSKLEQAKLEVQKKAHEILKQKLKDYQLLLANRLDSAEKHVADAFSVYYPSEMYLTYEAFDSETVYANKFSKVNNTQKEKTYYYNPIPDKDFDFVINPIVFEPSIQLVYEIQMKLDYKKPAANMPRKEVYYIGNNGQLVKIPN